MRARIRTPKSKAQHQEQGEKIGEPGLTFQDTTTKERKKSAAAEMEFSRHTCPLKIIRPPHAYFDHSRSTHT